MKIPILHFDEILSAKDKSVPRASTSYFNYLANNKNESSQNELFAIEIKDDKFFPTFPSDTTLIINSKLLPPTHNDYIIVEFKKNKSITIKRFYYDPPNEYLISLKQGLENIIYSNKEHKIVGVITEAHMQLK